MPALNDEAEVAVPPDGDHEYVSGTLPPVTCTDALPFVPPLQLTSETVDKETTGPGRSATAIVAVEVQLFASVITTEYCPVARLFNVAVFVAAGVHAYE